MNYTETLINNLEALKDYLSVVNDEECIELLNDTLDDISDEDGFGTEGQLDPRGDKRNRRNKKLTPVQWIDNLITMIKNEDEDDAEEISNGYLESFQELFNIFGCNEQHYREQLENEERVSDYMNNLYSSDDGFSQY